MIDCLVIGKGPAGISCAIYLKRFNINVVVIGKDNGTLQNGSLIENYYGIDSIDGNDLIEKGVNQAKKLGIEVIDDEVISIEKNDFFKITTKNYEFNSKCVFLACGKPRNKLKIAGIEEYDGKGISYCAICDGFFYRKKRIGIIGAKEYMISEYNILKRFSSDIVIFTNGELLDLDAEIVYDPIVSFYGDTKLSGLKTTKNSYDLDACFIANGSASGVSFAKHLGIILDENDNIIVDKYQTNIGGLFAGGDIIGGVMQVVKAASDGACAAIEINKYLKK